MPKTQVYFYAENGQSPVLDWFAELSQIDSKAYDDGRDRISLLKEFGHELRRPISDYLDDGIYELRWKHGHVQYRVLYFFMDATSRWLDMV